MKNQLIIGIIVIFGLLNINLNAKDATSSNPLMEKDGSISLPIEKNQKSVKFTTQNTANMPEFYNFTMQHGKWTLLTDKTTKTPFIAYGDPIQITGYNEITKDNVEAAAISFIKEYSNLLMVEAENLKFVKATHIENKWIVLYSQYYNNAEVLFSKVQLTISPDAKVFMFNSKYYSDINIVMTPEISYATAMTKATVGFETSKTKQMNSTLSAPKMLIVPVANGETVAYKLVYKVNFNTTDFTGKFTTYVDVHSGNVIYRKNQVHNASTKVHVHGLVNMEEESNNYKDIPLTEKYVTIGGTKYTTDNNGDISLDITASQSYGVKIDGPWINIKRAYQSGQNYSYKTTSITSTINAGDNLDLYLSDDNSENFERNVFNYGNVAHKWIRTVDTNLSVMDYQTGSVLYYDDQSFNAYSSGDTICFTGLNDANYRLAEMPGIFYHEYGHSVNFALYKQQGATADYGMINDACNEGTADLSAALMLDNPNMSKGYSIIDTSLEMRQLVNKIVYPDSLVFESHYDGQVISGAFWDIRRATSIDFATHLFHFSRYLIPDDIDDGIAFHEWFIDALTTDDDDNNIYNGTPNMKIIAQAFNNHNIGTNYWYAQEFTHTAISDVQEDGNAISVNFTLADLFTNYGLDSVSVIYTTDNFATTNRLFAQNLGNGQYSASIPAQTAGTIVKYYMLAFDKISEESLTFSNHKSINLPYEFNVGYTSYFVEPFDKNNGWSLKSGDDNATSGKFEIATPQDVDWTVAEYVYMSYTYNFYYTNYQTGTDHSASGTKCLVTGASTDEFTNWYDWYAYSSYGHYTTTFYDGVPNGKTTATSAKYDLSTFTKPLIRFWFWMSNVSDPIYYDGNYTKGSFYVEITSDDGANWKRVYTNQNSYQEWVKVEFVLDDSYKTSQFRIRFIDDAPYITNDYSRTTECELLVDDFELMSLTNSTAPILSVKTSDPTEFAFRYYPNPVEEYTTISFVLSEPQRVNMKIVNMLGQDVCTLIDSYLDAGSKSIDWNACYTNGTKVNPGMYYIRFLSGSDLITEKLIVK